MRRYRTYEPDPIWEFDMVSRIKFGVEAIEELPSALQERNVSTVLIITDEGIETAGIINDVKDILEGFEYHLHIGAESEPTLADFRNAISAIEDTDPELIVGIGGGSSMDIAKAASTVHGHDGEPMEYASPPVGGGKSFQGPGIPAICVPTTSGTGSETSPVAVASLPDENVKVGISSRYQIPEMAIIDPLLTVSLPSGPTAASGMDALGHAIEAYTTVTSDVKPRPESPDRRPSYNGRSILTDQHARTAIELIGNNLRPAVDQGTDLEARENMALASSIAGMAFTNAGVTINHAMAMAVGSEYDVSHGQAVAVFLPETMRYNVSSGFERFIDIANLLGENTDEDSRDEAGRKAAEAVEKLSTHIGISGGIGRFGVTEEDVPELAEKTMSLKRLHVGNPRRIDKDDLEGIFREAL